ncbi:MAG: hypothetical protein R3D85_00945 [Paracoccaceae bacterium]
MIGAAIEGEPGAAALAGGFDERGQFALQIKPLAGVERVVAAVEGQRGGQADQTQLARGLGQGVKVGHAREAVAQPEAAGQPVAEFARHAEGQRGVALDIGGLVQIGQFGLGEEQRVGAIDGGFLEPQRKGIVDALGPGADLGDLAIQAAAFRPCPAGWWCSSTRQGQPVEAGKLQPAADPPRFAVEHVEADVQTAVGVHRFALAQRDRLEGAGLAQPGGGLVDGLGREDLALGQARDAAQARWPHAAVAGDHQLAETHLRAGRQPQIAVEPRLRVVRQHRLPVDARLGVAGVAPVVDRRLRGLAHHRGAGRGAVAITLGRGGARHQRADPGLTEAEQPARRHLDLDLVHPGRIAERIERGGLAPVDQDMDRDRIITRAIGQFDQPGVIGAGGGDDLVRGGIGVAGTAPSEASEPSLRVWRNSGLAGPTGAQIDPVEPAARWREQGRRKELVLKAARFDVMVTALFL